MLCFSIISLGNFISFLLFCALRVQVLQNLWLGCNLLLFLNQKLLYAQRLVRAVGN